MSEYIEVTTQKQLDEALKLGVIPVCKGDGYFVVASGSASVKASGSASVKATDSASVEASGSASVEATDSASVQATGAVSVRAYGSASVDAYDATSVDASGAASVQASGRASVRASGAPSVRAYGSASVYAYDATSVRAYDSSSVHAYDATSVRAYDSSSVKASNHVVIHKHTTRYGAPQITGGVVIDVPNPQTIEEWCEYRGVEINDGTVVLFKAVNDDFKSEWGVDYTPGTTPVAPDWDGGELERGKGLHFCARPWDAASFDRSATRFVACPIRAEHIAVYPAGLYPQRVKAKECCAPVWEVDRDGKCVGA